MGQPITVTARPGASPSIRLFDLNRSLTGMEIERYHTVGDTKGDRPPDVLARRLFDLGATQVTIYSSAVTVQAPPVILEHRVVCACRNTSRRRRSPMTFRWRCQKERMCSCEARVP